MFSSPLIHDVRVDAIAIVGDLWTNEKVEQVPPGTAQYNEHRVGMMGDGLEPHSLRVFAVLSGTSTNRSLSVGRREGYHGP